MDHPLLYVIWCGLVLFIAMIPIFYLIDRGKSIPLVLILSASVGLAASASAAWKVRKEGSSVTSRKNAEEEDS